MNEILSASDYQLAVRARRFKFDPHLEAAADLFDRDPHAWAQLPVALQDASGIYRDLRDGYRAAVQAGLINPDDRGPCAA